VRAKRTPVETASTRIPFRVAAHEKCDTPSSAGDAAHFILDFHSRGASDEAARAPDAANAARVDALYRDLARFNVAQTLLSVLVRLATMRTSTGSAPTAFEPQPLHVFKAQTGVSVPHHFRRQKFTPPSS